MGDIRMSALAVLGYRSVEVIEKIIRDHYSIEIILDFSNFDILIKKALCSKVRIRQIKGKEAGKGRLLTRAPLGGRISPSRIF